MHNKMIVIRFGVTTHANASRIANPTCKVIFADYLTVITRLS